LRPGLRQGVEVTKLGEQEGGPAFEGAGGMGAEGGFRQARGGGKRRNIGWRADGGGQARGREFGHARIGGPDRVTGTRPATSSSSTWVRPRVSPRWMAQPMVGWPAKGISAPGVKMRTLALPAAVSGLWMKIVSAEVELPGDRLHLRVCSARRPPPTMASGLPVKGVSVKTS
jgi:hypothetical protein